MTEAGERDAVFVANRRRLFGLAYRLLGSVQDAEDVVQDSWLRWRQVDGEIGLPDVYLRRITASLSLDRLRVLRRERERYVGPWLPVPELDELPDSHPADDNPADRHDRDQHVSLGFLHLLAQLNPVERAVFVLREAFEDDYSDIADSLGKTAENCRQIHHRARRKVEEQPASREAEPEEHARLFSTFLYACQTGDVPLIQQTLAKEAILYSDGGGKVKAALRPIYGADKVIRFMLALARKQPPDLSMALETVNGRMGLVLRRNGQMQQVISACVSRQKIEALYFQLNPDKLGYPA